MAITVSMACGSGVSAEEAVAFVVGRVGEDRVMTIALLYSFRKYSEDDR